MSNATNQIIAQHLEIEEIVAKGLELITNLKVYIQSNLQDVLELEIDNHGNNYFLQFEYFGSTFLFRVEIYYRQGNVLSGIAGYYFLPGQELVEKGHTIFYPFDSNGNISKLVGGEQQSVPSAQFPDFFLSDFFAALTTNGGVLVLKP